ncbi:hypothetical protein [uncultured Roseobacter sp.]|uniref:hypothetical protein n=1 Tax=uncultured Roseobacter sp. TaxID=114847 RepID=UPI00262DB9D8|nr:hypothetical protein [uncultured Roseobacter sp.]
MRWVALVLCLLIPAAPAAQTRSVAPSDAVIWVEVEETEHIPLVKEMVLITIRGIYRRHITREKLVQPSFDGFSWTQLGDDTWREERLEGALVKTFTRRMAIYPDRAGTLEIGAFAHNLTLTDERDNWFEHAVSSAPVRIEVAPAPDGPDWWFPVRQLRISDQWSNAPDQLTRGEGVLRVVRIEALGVTPEMLPPMPELTSPSGRIFAHPEQRFVELSPWGPQSFAFWRWTIQPGNDTSTIVEPMGFDYFDTVNRVARSVTISAQRVAYGSVVPQGAPVPEPVSSAVLPGWSLAVLGGLICIGGTLWGCLGRRLKGCEALSRFGPLDPLTRGLRRAARQGGASDLRRAATALMRRDGPSARRMDLLKTLDRSVFAPGAARLDLRHFAREFLKSG